MWKRIAAWMFDGILTATLAVGFGLLLSFLLGFDAHNDKMEASMSDYETRYGVVFDITQDAYLAMSDGQRQNYEDAYAARLQKITLQRDDEYGQGYRLLYDYIKSKEDEGSHMNPFTAMQQLVQEIIDGKVTIG